jgi:response regulator RpfG family c-di-GMP phosphodiesterase
MTTTEQPPRILILSGDADRRRQLADALAGNGYHVVVEGSGIAGLVRVVQTRPTLVLLEHPGIGLDIVPEALAIDPHLAIIVLTDAADPGTAIRCLRAGVLHCVASPLEPGDLEELVGAAVERCRVAAVRAALSPLESDATRGPAGRGETSARQANLMVKMLESLVLALEARSPYLKGHATRVAELGATIAAELRLADSEIELVRLAGRLRDLGMIGIRDEVLNKHGRLTPAEHAHVQEHVRIGVRILTPLGNLTEVVDIVQSHHERWDGAGYPNGLDGRAIPVAARILHTADVFDALTSARPYQETMSRDNAIERIQQLAGQAFDPLVADALAGAVARHHTLDFVRDTAMPMGLLESLTE